MDGAPSPTTTRPSAAARYPGRSADRSGRPCSAPSCAWSSRHGRAAFALRWEEALGVEGRRRAASRSRTTITFLIVDGNHVVAVDPKGKKTEIWSAPDLTLSCHAAHPQRQRDFLRRERHVPAWRRVLSARRVACARVRPAVCERWSWPGRPPAIPESGRAEPGDSWLSRPAGRRIQAHGARSERQISVGCYEPWGSLRRVAWQPSTLGRQKGAPAFLDGRPSDMHP